MSKIINIDKIYYINLDRRPDRNINLGEQLRNSGLVNISERVRAIDGKQLDLNTVNHIITKPGILDALHGTKNVGIPLTKGAVGCAMSHRSVWIKVRDDPRVNSALILEDDIMIDKDFVHKFNIYQNHIPNNYDILFLGYHPASIKGISKNVNDVYVRSKKVYGLFGYIITKHGAKKLLNMFPISYQVDTALYRYVNNNGLNAYLLKPNLRLFTSEPSEIASKFGTDIQVREGFPLDCAVIDNTYMYVILIIVILIIVILLKLF